MRLPVLLAAMIAGAVHTAAWAGDRYGMADAAPPTAQPSFLDRALGWANKQSPSDTDAAPMVYAQPEPMALAGQFLRGRGPAQAGALRPSPSDRSQVAYAPIYPPFVPQEPYRAAAVRAAPAPPPAPPEDAPPPEDPTASPPLAGGLPAYKPPAPARIAAPQHLAEVATAAHGTGEQARLYSVHRPYGLTPDAIPEPAQGQGYVLIGQSGGGVAQAPSDDDGAKDDADGDGGEKRERPF